jgi:predicted DCC family thiol-disulfide oxidoreductase YuxK
MPVKTGWTGGQYSMFRALFGVYLFIHFIDLVPWGAEIFSNRGALADRTASPLLYLFPNLLALYDPPWFVTALLISAAAASLCFVIGFYDRAAALIQWYVLACLFGRNPLISNPAMPFVGWMLLAHVFLPPAPFGSLVARGRIDPRGGWHMPQTLYGAAWIVMALAYSYSGYTKLISPSWVDGSALARVLENPLARPTFLRELFLALPPILLSLATWVGLALELFYAPLAFFRRLRPWIWLAMVLMHLGLLTLVDFADLTFGMLFLHAFTFDPAWIAPKAAAEKVTVYYDGHCGLCHGFVRFVLAEDRIGNNIAFSPLQGDRFAASVPADKRAGLADSVVVQVDGGGLLTRSCAVLKIAQCLGGLWRILAIAGGFIPSSLRDGVYDFIAGIRRRVFGAPPNVCPILPAELRERFHA